MKKVFKSLMVGALAIPCAFAFTGCGDNAVNIDTSGNYKDLQATTAYSEINTLVDDGALDFEGVRFTIKQNANGNGMSGDVRLDGSAIYNENGVEFAITVNSKINMSGVNLDATMSFYMHENVLYIQSGDQKLKIDTTTTTDPDLGEYARYLALVPNEEMIVSALEVIEGYVSVSQKSDVDGVVKYHIQGVNEEFGKNEYWLVLKDGKFDGFKGTSESTMQGMKTTSSINVETYTGTIDMPSFDGFVDYTAEV